MLGDARCQCWAVWALHNCSKRTRSHQMAIGLCEKHGSGDKNQHIQRYRLRESLQRNSTVDCLNVSMARAQKISNAGSSQPGNEHVFEPRNWAGDWPDGEKTIINSKPSGRVFAARKWPGFRGRKVVGNPSQVYNAAILLPFSEPKSRPESGLDFGAEKRRAPTIRRSAPCPESGRWSWPRNGWVRPRIGVSLCCAPRQVAPPTRTPNV